MSLLRITTVTALPGQRLQLALTDGSTIEREVGPLLVGPIFDDIRSKPEVFARARVEGGSVIWPNGADLCPDVLIWGGAPPADPSIKPPRELLVAQ
jgi:hypothetical protein